jgi:hypothetical protein
MQGFKVNHKLIFILMIMILVLLSSIPGKYSLIPELKLSGVQLDRKNPFFTISDYTSGKYQKDYSDLINQNFKDILYKTIQPDVIQFF